MDFGQPQTASHEINAWVEKQTNGKIKNLISPQSLNSLTRLVLVNAIYFKGTWVRPFKNIVTQEQTFGGRTEGESAADARGDTFGLAEE